MECKNEVQDDETRSHVGDQSLPNLSKPQKRSERSFDWQGDRQFNAYLLGWCIHQHYSSLGVKGRWEEDRERIDRMIKIHDIIREELERMREGGDLEDPSFTWWDFERAASNCEDRIDQID
jgi:hypothetical protein